MICCVSIFSIGVNAAGIKIGGDIYLGIWSPFTKKWEGSTKICTYSEAGEELYRVTAIGVQNGSKFALANDIQQYVDYRLTWHTGRRLRQREQLQSNVPSKRLYKLANERTCADGANAELRVKINKRQLDRAIPGIYKDSLLVVLTAE